MRLRRALYAAALLLLPALRAPAASDSLTLAQAVERALRHNGSLAAAQRGIDQSQAQLDAARSDFFPTLSATAGGSIISENEVSGFGGMGGFGAVDEPDQFTYSLGAAVQQPLYTGGLLRARHRLSKANLAREQADMRRREDQLVLDVIRSFYAILYYQQVLEQYRETLAQMQRHLESVQSRYNEGLAPRFDLLRAEVQLENFRPRLAQMERNIALSRETMALQLGTSSDSLPPLAGDFAFVEISVDQEQAIRQALQERPEIATMEQALVAAQQGIAVSTAGYKPQLALGLNYSLQEGFDNEPDNNWSVGVNLRWTLFDGGGTQAVVREARARYDQTRIERRNLEDRIELEVKQSVINLHNRKADIATQERTVELSREALAIADERYKSGLLAHNEYLDAQLDLVEARTNYLKALSDYLVARAEYARVIGDRGELL